MQVAGHPTQQPSVLQALANSNESLWMQLGQVAETLHDDERAIYFYEQALRINSKSISALGSTAGIWRKNDKYEKAIEFFQRILNIDNTNGEVWGAIGHCQLMLDDLQKAYHSYQQALYYLPNPKDPKLWYGIGILYDRYGSFEHAEEAFTSVIGMDPDFDKANEIYFRLGIIYKQHQKYDTSLECFRYILHNPPKPLTEHDIYFQIGHVFEQKKEFDEAKAAYERVLKENPNHAKVLQQLGWLFHQETSGFTDQDTAITYLKRSLELEMSDAQTWYLLGRSYMVQQKYVKAYDAYQQAVYRDGRNPTFWCSIGVLYYKINQFSDALDAYTRAIHLNPYISEVWYDLGTLYESCNNQVQDALDAYKHALELDPENEQIKQTIETLKRNAEKNGGKTNSPSAPGAVKDTPNLEPIKAPASAPPTDTNKQRQIYHGPSGPSKGLESNVGAPAGGPPPRMLDERRPSVGNVPTQVLPGMSQVSPNDVKASNWSHERGGS